MKTKNRNFRSNRNFIKIIGIAVIAFGISVLIMSCPGPNDEHAINQDSIDSVKALELKTVDTAAIKDTSKTQEVSTTKQ
jgi:hypothetical protein